MSENTVPTEASDEPIIPQPGFTGGLRDLLKQRVETKIRRIHKAWFCFDPNMQAELDAATAELAEMVGAEILKQQGQKRAGKYAVPTRISLAEERRNALVEKSRQVGAMGVFQNLTDGQIEAVEAEEGSFLRAKSILAQAFLRWETADGSAIPADQLGLEDLEMLLQPEVLAQGEWLPLAATIYKESKTAVDRPTLPKS